MTAIRRYIQESIKEFNNVTWPTRRQAIRITTIVFIFVIVSAIILGIVDYLFTVFYQALLSL